MSDPNKKPAERFSKQAPGVLPVPGQPKPNTTSTNEKDSASKPADSAKPAAGVNV